MARIYTILFSAAIAVVLMASLVTGADWMGAETRLLGIPAGNLTAWLLLIALAVLGCSLAWRSRLRPVALVAVGTAVLWLPVSIALFGNVYLSNTGPLRFGIWLGYTGFQALAPVLIVVLVGISRLATSLRAKG